jgi:TetR/AcrR family transcriptional regulator, cholesterol catabolism regulator
MATGTTEIRSTALQPAVRRSGNGRKLAREAVDSRFDRQLARVLEHAARIFCEKGYEGASMRDLSRASGMSLAGLYHYFESKEELLYLIQKHTFQTIIDNLRERLGSSTDPEERVRIFVENHLEYFLANKEAMKVLTHEDETLKNGRGSEVRAIKREYYRICFDLLEDLQRDQGLQFSGRLAVLSLFGMINWFYTWHNPRVDANAKALAEEMSGIFLFGVLPRQKTNRKVSKTKP